MLSGMELLKYSLIKSEVEKAGKMRGGKNHKSGSPKEKSC
jgi:hypothetical protein